MSHISTVFYEKAGLPIIYLFDTNLVQSNCNPEKWFHWAFSSKIRKWGEGYSASVGLYVGDVHLFLEVNELNCLGLFSEKKELNSLVLFSEKKELNFLVRNVRKVSSTEKRIWSTWSTRTLRTGSRRPLDSHVAAVGNNTIIGGNILHISGNNMESRYVKSIVPFVSI